jgi:heat shock protein 4
MVRKGDLPVIAGLNTRDSSIVAEYKEKEGEMYSSDKLVLDTEDRKNALEEFIYDQRSKVDERYKAYIQASEKETYLKALNEQEEWLYSDEGEEAKKSDYVQRLDALHKIGDPVMLRWKENEERPKAASALRDTIAKFNEAVQGGSPKYDHLSDDDKTKVIEKCATVEKWLSDNLIRVQEQAKNVNPKITVADMNKQRDDVLYTCNPIINKPKPKSAAPPPTETPKQEAPKEEAAKEDEPTEMDVD